jgi:hypothetical protein
MEPKELVANAEALSEALVQDAISEGLSYCDLLQTLEISLRIIRATYPGPAAEILHMSRVAEATFLAANGTSELKN